MRNGHDMAENVEWEPFRQKLKEIADDDKSKLLTRFSILTIQLRPI